MLKNIQSNCFICVFTVINIIEILYVFNLINRLHEEIVMQLGFIGYNKIKYPFIIVY